MTHGKKKSEYYTGFIGDITLMSYLDKEKRDKIKSTIATNFGALMNYNENGNIIYLSGDYDDTEEMVEKFIVKLLPIMDHSVENKIQAQGENREDKYDLIVMDKKLFVQEYEFSKSKLRLY